MKAAWAPLGDSVPCLAWCACNACCGLLRKMHMDSHQHVPVGMPSRPGVTFTCTSCHWDNYHMQSAARSLHAQVHACTLAVCALFHLLASMPVYMLVCKDCI